MQVLETKLTKAADAYQEYLERRRKEILNAQRRLKELYEMAMSMPATPMWEKYLVLVNRNGKPYLRKPPTKPPTEPKRKTHQEVVRLTKMVKNMSVEDVAALVGGEVVDVGEYLNKPRLKGKKAILVDGQLLNRSQAILKLMKGKRYAIPKTKLERLVELLEWALY